MTYDIIYTIGCFDHFHYGHKNILNKMKNMGKTLIVGVHDDTSLEKLKNLRKSDHQNIQKRMRNVKQIADHVYIIPDTDPTFYLKSMINFNQNSCYVRGNDMPNFPGRKSIEGKIDIKFMNYTKGISSTDIRKKLSKPKKNYVSCIIIFVIIIYMLTKTQTNWK